MSNYPTMYYEGCLCARCLEPIKQGDEFELHFGYALHPDYVTCKSSNDKAKRKQLEEWRKKPKPEEQVRKTLAENEKRTAWYKELTEGEETVIEFEW